MNRSTMPQKSRMITIRLSMQEYEEIKRHCIDIGEINLSEFARASMMHSMGAGDRTSPSLVQLQIAAIQNRLNRLEQRVNLLSVDS